jgi:hypothetical protein
VRAKRHTSIDTSAATARHSQDSDCLGWHRAVQIGLNNRREDNRLEQVQSSTLGQTELLEDDSFGIQREAATIIKRVTMKSVSEIKKCRQEMKFK